MQLTGSSTHSSKLISWADEESRKSRTVYGSETCVRVVSLSKKSSNQSHENSVTYSCFTSSPIPSSPAPLCPTVAPFRPPNPSAPPVPEPSAPLHPPRHCSGTPFRCLWAWSGTFFIACGVARRVAKVWERRPCG
ncbi:hypothetical protein O3P69_007379 [Scylla paramamosain]|uniref:Uncharacterized protein n=1 Tax=Scylla paramamosain TaxID=85552 RepID=A0AAW0V364_SCYPA